MFAICEDETGQEIAIDKLVWDYLERFEQLPAKLKFVYWATSNVVTDEKIPNHDAIIMNPYSE